MMLMSSELSAHDVVICVPARNEADRIGRLLTSLAAQTVACASRSLRVVVVCNNTIDDTARLARAFSSSPALDLRVVETDFPVDRAHAGTARRMAMDIGAEWLGDTIAGDGVLISTDADAVAPPKWVAANLAALARADLVGGRLVIADDNGRASPVTLKLHAKIDRYWAAVRALEDCIDPPAHDPAPRHGDHTGASLALRVSTYLGAGGVPIITSGEDNALVAAVEKSGGRVRHCPDVWIGVSSREEGRAREGMAKEMMRRRIVATNGEAYEVPTAAFWRNRLDRRAAFRAAWASDGAFVNAIACVAQREAMVSGDPAPVQPIDEAIATLDLMADRLRRGRAT